MIKQNDLSLHGNFRPMATQIQTDPPAKVDSHYTLAPAHIEVDLDIAALAMGINFLKLLYNPYIGIVTAMGMEFNLVKKILKIKKLKREKGYKVAVGSFGNMQVVVIKSGMGHKKARLATKYLLENFNIIAVVNAGIAGAIEPNLKIGDLVLGTEVMSEFEEGNREFTQFYKSGVCILELIKMLSGIKKEDCHIGKILSVRKGVGSKERKEQVFRKFNAWAVDMEAASVYKECSSSKIPFITIKSISDLADESIGFSEDVMADDGKLKPGKMLKTIISRPISSITGMIRMMKNMNFALSRLKAPIESFLKIIAPTVNGVTNLQSLPLR